MGLSWSSLTCTPSDEAIEQLFASWAWLLQVPFKPILFSILGDAFLESESGEVFWLETGGGELSRVADSVDAFRELLKTELANDWFLPSFVEQLHAAGKIPGEGSCYGFTILPIFRQGTFAVENVNAVPAREVFSLTGEIHSHLRDLATGENILLEKGS
jgi:Domain of unknown function (DUF1851)